ncbi:MAG: hypothetical protein M0C28_48940 [Candidatus Moduliflexus flocculans]|nr:hypothetical protein [Candidatus Moduliflexus flocculans]
MGLGLLDLIDEGNVGLIEAAKRFDPHEGRPLRLLRRLVDPPGHHPRPDASIPGSTPSPRSWPTRSRSMKRKTAELKTDLGREPTREEIARAMGITETDVEDLELLDERNLSLSDRVNDDDLEVEDRISDAASPSVEYQIIKASVQQQIRDILGELDEKEALVLKLRFGLDDDRPRTLQEIGDRLKLTRERIRQIEQKAMRKLSRSNKLQHLRGYLN